MKNFFPLLLAALLGAGPALAQTAAPDPVRAKLDLIFANLDKSQVPTGRLLEYAVPLAPVAAFDGAALRDSARTDLDGFRHLYATALSGRCHGTDTLPGLPAFNRREHAAAPERTYSASATVSLVLRPGLYLASGTPSAYVAPSIDFGDGAGYRSAAWNVPLAATYPSSGTKRVKVRFAYLDSPVQDATTGNTSARPASAITLETRVAWFDLTVWAQPPVARYGSSADFDTLFNAVANPDYYASHLGATVNVRFGMGHTRITKPYIVVEGYNTSRLAPHLVGENNRNNDVATFLRGCCQMTFTRLDIKTFASLLTIKLVMHT